MEKQQEAEAKVGEHWCYTWGRPCEEEAEDSEDVEQLSPELPDDDDEDDKGDEGAVGPKSEQRKLWHLFQKSATTVAQLYRGPESPQSELSMWDLFQSAAGALTNLYKESRDAQRGSFNLGVKVGYQRRIKEVLDWANKSQSTILREDLISFLCGKAPPYPPPAARHLPPPSQHIDLQPFQEATDLHDLTGAISSISMQSAPPSSPPHAAGFWNDVTSGDLQNSSTLKDDLSSCNSEAPALHLASRGNRKRTSAHCGDVITDTPTHKRNRMV